MFIFLNFMEMCRALYLALYNNNTYLFPTNNIKKKVVILLNIVGYFQAFSW